MEKLSLWNYWIMAKKFYALRWMILGKGWMSRQGWEWRTKGIVGNWWKWDIFLEIRLTHRWLSSNAWYLILRSYQATRLGFKWWQVEWGEVPCVDDVKWSRTIAWEKYLGLERLATRREVKLREVMRYALWREIVDGSEGTRTISVGHGYKCGYTLIGLSSVEGCIMRRRIPWIRE